MLLRNVVATGLKNLKLAHVSNGLSQWEREFTYHTKQMTEAARAYAAIVKARPDHTLSTAASREIDLYAKKTFGSRIYAPWLKVYAAWRGEFVPGCIPENYFQTIVTKGRGNNSLKTTGTASPFFFEDPSQTDLGYVLNGTLFDKALNVIEPTTFAEQFFERYAYLYLKDETVGQGRGVQRVTRAAFPTAISKVSNASLQYPVAAHPVLAAMSPDAVPTLRILTTNVAGHVRAIAATLRLGRVGETHVQSQTQVRVNIDLSTGRLSRYGALPDWTPTQTHPDTGHVFEEATVPSFDDARDLAIRLHARVPHTRISGWDLCVDESGEIKFFEVNGGNSGIKFHEANVGPIFAGYGLENSHL